MAKSPEEMAAAMIANMKEKTGKTMPQWLKIAKASKLHKHGELVKHLKSDHGMTHGFANLVAHENLQSSAASSNAGDLVASKGDLVASKGALVATQYSGKKADLKPIYDAVLAAVSKLGVDVEVAPKKAYVSLRRSVQFALVQPSTATRVDLGINLKGVKPQGKLEASGSFNSMVSHRVRLERAQDVDSKVKAWLKQAYVSA